MLTTEQKKVRLGRITGSIMKTIMEGGHQAWRTLLDRKKLEIEQPEEALGSDIHSPSLDWGNRYEPAAIANYELIHGVEVEVPEVSIIHPEIDYVAALPDGLTDEAVQEVKCPYNEEVHAMTVIYGTGADTYKPQIQTELWCTGKEVCHFISYDPRYKDPEKQIIVIEVERDEKYIEQMAEKCAKFYEYLTTDTRPEGMPTEIPQLF